MGLPGGGDTKRRKTLLCVDLKLRRGLKLSDGAHTQVGTAPGTNPYIPRYWLKKKILLCLTPWRAAPGQYRQVSHSLEHNLIRSNRCNLFLRRGNEPEKLKDWCSHRRPIQVGSMEESLLNYLLRIS